MMANISRLERRRGYFLLLLVVSGLAILPFASCQFCNTEKGEPQINISSTPPSNKLSIGTAINLTCTAWQTVQLAKNQNTIPYKIEWFYEDELKPVLKCQTGLPPRTRLMKCTLEVDVLTDEKLGNYTCRASNSYYRCSTKRFQVDRQQADLNGSRGHSLGTGNEDAKRLEFVNVPVNQTALLGSNVTFNCTVIGHPKPTITWEKVNDSGSVQYNLAAESLTGDGNSIFSQLVITEVKSKDYGVYHCVAKNSVGQKISIAVLGSRDEVNQSWAAPRAEGKEGPSTTSKQKNIKIIAISVTLSVAITFLGAISVFLQCFRGRCPRSKTYESTNYEKAVTFTGQIQEENQLEAIYDYIDNNPSSITAQEHDEKPLSGHSLDEHPLLGTSRAESPVKKPPQARPLPPIPHIEKEGQRMEENSEHNVTCSRMLQSESQNPNFQTPDKGRRGNILEGQGIPLDIENNTGLIAVLQETGKEPWLFPSSGPMSETEAETKPMLSVLGVDVSLGELPRVRELLPTPDFEAAPPRPPKPTKETEEGTKYNESSSINSQEIEEDYEIDLKRLEVQHEVLGEGDFGIVYKGRYHGKDMKVVNVAVKQLKDTADNNDKAALLSEIQMLKRAGKHPNIVNLVGACTQGENILLVTDLIPGGTLESFLTSKPTPGDHGKYENFKCALNDRELIKIALQIAKGMQHLESKKCIHGDVAARNVFIDENNKVAKLGDFGLARDISDRGIYNKTSNGRVPWRWLSIESLSYRVYTSQSDVWSFGILLWEIATFGELPYPDIATPWALKSFLSSGRRMPRPDHCTEELYALMQSCWMENPLMRPTFQDITKRIRYFLRKVKKSYVNVQDDDLTDDSEIF